MGTRGRARTPHQHARAIYRNRAASVRVLRLFQRRRITRPHTLTLPPPSQYY